MLFLADSADEFVERCAVGVRCVLFVERCAVGVRCVARRRFLCLKRDRAVCAD